MATTKQQYSKEEREEFRVIIKEKIKASEDTIKSCNKQLASLKEDLREGRVEKDDLVFHHNTMSTIWKELRGVQGLVERLRGAYQRTLQDDFGVCNVTGNLIPPERLRIVPHTTSSVEGKEIRNS